MITAQVENFSSVVQEALPLLDKHYEVLSNHKGHFQLSPRLDVYREREARGELCTVTLRHDGKLVGYWNCIVAPGLHYSTCLTSIMDIWFIDPEHALGKAPIILMRAVENEMCRRGVKLWYAGEKLHKPCGRLFEKLGFEKVEATYAKWL